MNMRALTMILLAAGPLSATADPMAAAPHDQGRPLATVVYTHPVSGAAAGTALGKTRQASPAKARVEQNDLDAASGRAERVCVIDAIAVACSRRRAPEGFEQTLRILTR